MTNTTQPLTQKRMASAVCGECGQQMQSQQPGDFSQCECNASFVDTDRWDANRHRYGGSAKPDTKGLFWIYGPNIPAHAAKKRLSASRPKTVSQDERANKPSPSVLKKGEQ